MKVEKEAMWLCDCGKETPQPVGGKVVMHCVCGKSVSKLRDPDGVETVYVGVPDWFKNEFNDQENKIQKTIQTIHGWEDRRWSAEVGVRQEREALINRRKVMDSIINKGLKRLGLHRNKDMEYRYNPAMNKFMGRKVEKARPV